MAIFIVENSGKVSYGIKRYICKTMEDIPVEVNGEEIAPGSKVYISDEKKTYMLNTSGQWVEITESGGGGGGASSIDELSDVTITSPQEGQVLAYDETSGTWINVANAAADKMDKANPTGTGSLSLNRKANTTIGTNSVAEGIETTASGNYSHAEGAGTTASGVQAHAEGLNTTASDISAHAEGAGTTASGQYSHAEGAGTIASGSYSHAEGGGTETSGQYSHAEGMNTIAAGSSQHVSGKFNIVDNNNTYAEIIGNGTNAARSNARTLDWEGNETLAGDLIINGNRSVANALNGIPTELSELSDVNIVSTPEDGQVLSYDATSDKWVAGAPGSSGVELTQAEYDALTPEEQTNGTEYFVTDGTNAPVEAAGVLYDNEDSGLVASDVQDAIDELNYNMSSLEFDLEDLEDVNISNVQDGQIIKYDATNQTWVNAVNATADKMDKVDPTGTGSFSLNRKANTTVGTNSVAEGYNITASGNYSHAEGNGTTASGYSSHAEGAYTTASGDYTHAEGNATTASGHYSHTEGAGSLASGYYSHAEGNNTMASGENSHAEGESTIAAGANQHVGGKYNISDNNNTYAEIIGNGTEKSDRSNARTLDWQGNETLAGDIIINGNQSVTQALSKIVIQKTQAEYDLLTSVEKNNGSIYKITDNGKMYCLDREYHPIKELTQAEYDALTPAEQSDGTIYMISDADISVNKEPVYFNATSGGSSYDRLDYIHLDSITCGNITLSDNDVENYYRDGHSIVLRIDNKYECILIDMHVYTNDNPKLFFTLLLGDESGVRKAYDFCYYWEDGFTVNILPLNQMVQLCIGIDSNGDITSVTTTPYGSGALDYSWLLSCSQLLCRVIDRRYVGQTEETRSFITELYTWGNNPYIKVCTITATAIYFYTFNKFFDVNNRTVTIDQIINL